jgi:hemerythrin-like domain-containing protein
MDLIDHLMSEHRQVEDVLATLAESDPGEARDALVDEITIALQTHMAVEEEFLYPIITDALGGDAREEAEVEHGLVREGLASLSELKDEPGFGAAVAMLNAGIAHHVDEEESEVFPQLRKHAAEQLDELDPHECLLAVNAQAIDLTKDELYRMAREVDLPGRSSMTRDELAEALAQL